MSLSITPCHTMPYTPDHERNNPFPTLSEIGPRTGLIVLAVPYRGVFYCPPLPKNPTYIQRANVDWIRSVLREIIAESCKADPELASYRIPLSLHGCTEKRFYELVDEVMQYLVGGSKYKGKVKPCANAENDS